MEKGNRNAPPAPLVSVAKEFQFHAAHVLPNHDGPCARLHGHTYRLRVTVSGRVHEVHPAGVDPAEGMIVDFSILKGIYESRIEPLVEHQRLDETLAGLIPVTTCEMMAAWIFGTFEGELLKRDLELISVRLWETPTSYAEVIAR